MFVAFAWRCFSVFLYSGLRNGKSISVFKNLAIWRIEEVISVFFQRIHVRIVIRRTDISISIRPFDHQIWQAGISTRCDSNETNEAGTGGVIISSSRDKLNTLHLHYQSAYDHQTWQGNLP